MLVNFLPNLNRLNTLEAQKTLDEEGEEGFLKLRNIALKEDSQSARGEFIFVIDRSGSMYGQRIVNLRNALEKFLKILPKDSYFNILSFGSTFSLYKPQSIKYDDKNL
ncbi:MAG: VWA domain-containing protein, partial [Chitinophagaceae bacterium]